MPEHQQMQQSKKPDTIFQKVTPAGQTHVSNPASIIQRAKINPKSMTHADVMQLQRTIGNKAVGRLLSGIGSFSTAQQAPVQRQEIPEDEETCPSCMQRQEIQEEEEPLQGKMIETIQRQEIPEEEEPLQGKLIEPIQRQEIPGEEEPLQRKMAETVQCQRIPEEEDPLQGKMVETIQRQEIPEEEVPLQGKMIGTVQRQEIPEEEKPLQGKFESIQLQEIPEEEEPLQDKMIETIQRQEIPGEEEPIQTKRENKTGMPDNLKAGVESLSEIDMSDVRVHYNSDKPAELGALAYTQGTIINVSPGQERHLPHEAWHVVQQAQGRVKPTMQAKGVAINDDERLEREADVMGRKALRQYTQVGESKGNKSKAAANSVAPKKSVKQSFGFLDNHPKAIPLRKPQSMAVNNTAQHQPIQRIPNYSTLEEPIIRKMDYGVDTKAVVQRDKKGAAAGAVAGAGIGALGFFAGPIVGGITTAIGAGVGGVVGHFITNKDIVTIARNAANDTNSNDYRSLSARMCWDAVGYCGYLAGLTPTENGGGKNIITVDAEIVSNSNSIPIGHIIGFFENNDLKHAMISLGGGTAAGNKNSCMGIGGPVGWEALQLPIVNHDGEYVPNNQQRTIVMRHKSF